VAAAGSDCQRIAKEGDKVGIGGSIFLIALGAIFAFAVEYELGWLDLSVVGWVLMIAGVVGLIMTTWFWQSRRRTVVAPPAQQPVVPVQDDRVVEEYREVRRPPANPY
jgi:protein-S-isoprenylcysteine O-methyltransferase Ste14